MGIPCALLNSSIGADEQAQVIRKARAGEYRLLYLSPERLARADTLDWLRGISDFILRNRRSALYLGMGPRVSA